MPNESVPLITRREARRKLTVAKPVFEALWTSGLLGLRTTDDLLPEDGIEHYKKYGTQWLTRERFGELGTRMVPQDFYDEPPKIPGIGTQPPDTQARGLIYPPGVPQDAWERDTGWLAQFYLTPNQFFWPNPADMAMIGSTQLKLDAPKKVRGTTLPTCAYPDITGSLAMISVTGVDQPSGRAFEIAYDVVAPVLDELSAKYDLPLPIAHTTVFGIPSGTTFNYFSMRTKSRKIERSDAIDSHCPYPELRDAVALYREAVSSNNPFHKFLTFWKVHENAVYVRTGWRQRYRRADTKIQDELIPDVFAFGSDDESLYRELHSEHADEDDLRNLSFQQAKQKLNRPYRVALAHAGELKDGKPLTGASAEDVQSVSYKVPMIRYMAHVVLENVRATLASSDDPSEST